VQIRAWPSPPYLKCDGTRQTQLTFGLCVFSVGIARWNAAGCVGVPSIAIAHADL